MFLLPRSRSEGGDRTVCVWTRWSRFHLLVLLIQYYIQLSGQSSKPKIFLVYIFPRIGSDDDSRLISQSLLMNS